jgi:hypothetical protein
MGFPLESDAAVIRWRMSSEWAAHRERRAGRKVAKRSAIYRREAVGSRRTEQTRCPERGSAANR